MRDVSSDEKPGEPTWAERAQLGADPWNLIWIMPAKGATDEQRMQNAI
jgi:hypothetical protein